MKRQDALNWAKHELNSAYRRLEKVGAKGKTRYIEVLEMVIEVLEQEPCEDCVSRQAVAEVLLKYAHSTEGKAFAEFLVSQINNLPPVNSQELKTGHWTEVTNGRGGHECDICHDYAPSYQNGDEYLTKYCPSCGARMIEPQESEEV